MMANWFASILSRLKGFWDQFNQIQKVILSAIGASVLLILCAILFITQTTSYSLLFSPDRMQNIDIAEVKTYLENANIPYKMKNESLILVPSNRVHQVRMELAVYGLPKVQSSKGLEVFDNTTWVKGEKELQMLEIRALKGQLEKDISQFENIRSANVILDIPPARPFGDSTYKTKASVILNLMPGARLGAQEIRAITYHVAGAVRGLSANMIAISDTTGKLYQAFDLDGTIDAMRLAETYLEDHLKAKIDGLLATVVGFDNFYTTVQVQMAAPTEEMKKQSNPGRVESISIGVLIDKHIFKEPSYSGMSQETVQTNIENQLATILKAYGDQTTYTVDFVDFHPTFNPSTTNAPLPLPQSGSSHVSMLWIFFSVFLLAGLAGLIYALRTKNNQAHVQPESGPEGFSFSQEDVDQIRKILSNVHAKDLAEFLSHHSEENAAELLVGTSPKCFSEVLSWMPESKKNQILVEFSKISSERFHQIAKEFATEYKDHDTYIQELISKLAESDQSYLSNRQSFK